MKRITTLAIFLVLLSIITATQAVAQSQRVEDNTEALQRASQNPVADLISIPLQNNFNFGVGPQDKMQYVGNIQPVVPFHATENWNVITRTIVPFVYQPELAPGVGDVFGLGDIQFTAFLSPAKPGEFIWGVGPIQPFVNYNMADGWYLVSAPIITANMMADSSDRWTVPIGGGAGRIIRIDKLPVNFSLQGFYNVATPDAGPDWSIRFAIQLLLPASLL
jgi:hypothetical protein